MNADDKRRLKILGILLPILGLSLWFGSSITSSSPDISGGTAGGALIDPDTLGTIEIPEWLEPDGPGGGNGVERDPFRYVPRPTPAPPPRVETAPEPPPFVPPPAVPPPPPPVPFVYVGYGGVGESLAILWDDENELNRYVSEQDVVLGRYRVIRVTQDFVEIEDLQLGRTETLPFEGVD